MAWILLVLAGFLEAGWAVGLKFTDGFTRPWPTALTIAGIVLSLLMLAQAVRTLPIGTAYPIWVGIGAAGAAIVGMVWFKEPVTFGRLFFLALLLVAIVGLKATTRD